jgi:large subunit ribosomal protein L11
MAKKVKTVIKVNAMGGAANPAPPIGPALGQHGVNIMEFCTAYNEATKDQKGKLIPAEITIYEDRSFTFVTKLPPVSELIRQTLKIKKGSSLAPKEIVGTLSKSQVEKIAQEKMPDLNTNKLASAIKSVTGTAKSMGVKVEA